MKTKKKQKRVFGVEKISENKRKIKKSLRANKNKTKNTLL